MTYYVTVRTPPAIPPREEPKPLLKPGDEGFVYYDTDARKARALARKRDNPEGGDHFRNLTSGGQTPRRKEWTAQLPDGEFSRDDAANAWGVEVYCAKQRLESLRAVGLVDCHQRRAGKPGVWWRVE